VVLLKGGIYKMRLLDGVKCHHIHTKFHKDWFRNSKLIGEDTHTDTYIHRQEGDIALFCFQKKKEESRLKTNSVRNFDVR
jgi:hypothetical protein